jgi:tRNA/tmRNA/rRNA uracil-C5-methylase (TrmA/RlmC/RlmD family)
VSASIIKAANTLSKSLTHAVGKITGVFLYEEESHGRYYMGTKNPRVQLHLRKIFGKGEVYQRIAGLSFLYSPLSFSQVNHSIVEALVAKAAGLLDLQKDQTLYDLYCGYGLFSLCLADKVGKTVGVEMSPQSVEAAIANAKRNKLPHARFIRSDISGTSLRRIMSGSSVNDAVILDPPRKGTAEGVIETIAARKPKRVLHLFCNIDLLSSELRRWKDCGYKPVRAIPFDLFPGTSEVETMVELEGSRLEV